MRDGVYQCALNDRKFIPKYAQSFHDKQMSTTNLQRRLTSAKDVLGFLRNNTVVELNSHSLARYEDKLRPLFSDSYSRWIEELDENQQHERVELPRSTILLGHVLNAPIVTVTNLSVQPGEPYFVLWLLVSSYLPLVSACMAPLANLISLIGLVEHWRIEKVLGNRVHDTGPVFGLNILSFVLGIIGNCSLVINFSGKMRYIVTHTISISCWISAALVLLAAVLVANRDFHGPDPKYERSEGFWLAALTVFMYFGCLITVIFNFIGYKLGKYPPTFNLDKKERRLMTFTIAFSLWQGVCSLVMTTLIANLSYGTSLYYCTVSVLTIGLGDIVPITPGAKVFALVFSLVGVVFMGLIIAMIRQVVSSSAGPSVFWHLTEKRRVLLLKELQKRNEPMTAAKSFHLMRLIRKRARIHQLNMSLFLSLMTFIAFWLVGGAVFHCVEGWTYFNAIYFCFLCLITIGYGDFHPQSHFGRVFFIAWAIMAVPMMTILISNVGDTLFENSTTFHSLKKHLLDPRTYTLVFRPLCYFKHEEESQDHIEAELEEEEIDEDQEIESIVDKRSETQALASALRVNRIDKQNIHKIMEKYRRKSAELLQRVEYMREVLLDSAGNPQKRYDLKDWLEVGRNLKSAGEGADPNPYFWLDKDSPLRLPLKEPNFAFMKLFLRIESDIKDLVELQNEEMLDLVDPDRATTSTASAT